MENVLKMLQETLVKSEAILKSIPSEDNEETIKQIQSAIEESKEGVAAIQTETKKILDANALADEQIANLEKTIALNTELRAYDKFV